MDLRGWVVTCVDGMRLVGRSHEGDVGQVLALSPVYEFRVDVCVLPAEVNIPGKGRVMMPMPQLVRQLMPVHGTPSITSYPLPEDARLIALDTLSHNDQRDYGKMIEQVRDSLRQAESGLVTVG